MLCASLLFLLIHVANSQKCEDTCSVQYNGFAPKILSRDGVCDETYGICPQGTDCSDCEDILPVWEIVVASITGMFALCTCCLIIYRINVGPNVSTSTQGPTLNFVK
jgi:hypothetical protein